MVMGFGVGEEPSFFLLLPHLFSEPIPAPPGLLGWERTFVRPGRQGYIRHEGMTPFH